MPSVHIAHKTLKLIDDLVQKDQGALFRQWEGRVLPHIGDAYRAKEEGHRSHLGASILGAECARAVYYSFRWATKPNFEGRMIRLFNRGHLEEGRFIALLLMMGAEVLQQDEHGKQFRISFAEGHGGGSGDGMGLGIPDLVPGTWALTEFKTHSEKSFIDLAGDLASWRAHVADPTRNAFMGKGVRETKFEHFVQMQLYMRKMELACAVYFAINKNTDDIYAEIVLLDSALADEFLARGEKLVYLEQPPKKISTSPGFYKCRFCDHRPVCHLKAAPDINCRTCQYSTPERQTDSEGRGVWTCALRKIVLSKELQQTGCDKYEKARMYDQ
jgi:hypothetical protein